MSEDKPVEEPVEVTEEPCEEVILPKKRMTTNACQPNNMGNEQNAVVQPLLTGLFLLILFFLVKSQSAVLDSNHLTNFL